MAKTLQGVVTSDVSDKTIVVTVRTRKTHPIYKKQFTVSTKFMAHDEKNEAKNGDKVIISETRPISAKKRFKLDKIIVKATIKHTEPESSNSDKSDLHSAESLKSTKDRKLETSTEDNS